MKITLISLGVICALLAGCCHTSTKLDAWRRAEETVAGFEHEATNGMAWPNGSIAPETVMTAGTQITAKTANGEVTIRAGNGFERFYTWDNATRSAVLWPRRQRWQGSLGIYYPGPGQHWQSNNGITRGVLNEGVLWFRSVESARKWIERCRSTGAACAHTESGLLVVFQKILPRKQVIIEVWQIMVDGEKPKAMPGGDNESVAVSQMP